MLRDILGVIIAGLEHVISNSDLALIDRELSDFVII